ncbi:DUF4179 domain-containing protein [Clostridium manihotivorum]|uniref:DUF4179 domain-containing protein n=1 Tax=Clostridium manihotivorum TaxID=2320868 RepID=A0A3R5QX98_9CLOT|nr:DUF4179 domain-containing protein [Clostridium manihotivorum]QAA34401.1 hypothetical protein C1I91_23705 [Clostridium manihotivorum]
MSKITDEYIINTIKDLEKDVVVPSYLNSIDKTIEMSKKRKNTYRKRNLTFASILLIVIIASTSTVFSKTFLPIFKSVFADEGVLKAQVNNKSQLVDKSVEAGKVTVSLKGVVADGIRTVLSIKIDGDRIDFKNLKLEGVYLVDSTGKKYEVSHYGQGELIKNQNHYETTMEFNGSPSKETKLKLNISKINHIDGPWNIEFNVIPTLPKSYNSSSNYSDGKITLEVSKATFSSTYTVIEGKIQGSDFNINSKLSNNNGETVSQLSGKKLQDGSFQLYYPPITKTSDLNLVITTPDGLTTLVNMKISTSN